MTGLLLLLSVAIGAALGSRAHSIPHLEHFEPHRQATIRRVLGSAYAPAPATPSSPNTFRPEDYGADCSGVKDSSGAIRAAIAAATAPCGSSAVSTLGGTECSLGGATLDMTGCRLAVASPIVWPCGMADFTIQGGYLNAIPGAFPAGETVLTLGNVTGSVSGAKKGTCVQNAAIMRVTVNGSDVAGGAIDVFNGQYVDVGPAVMVYGFTVTGMSFTGTGGLYLHQSWGGALSPSSKLPRNSTTATVVSLNGDQHDAMLSDLIFWSGRTGIYSQNGANQIRGVHPWNLVTTDGGVGIWLENGMDKVIDSYLDFTPLVIVDPRSVIVSNTLFLARGNLVIRSNRSKTVQGLTVTNNRWWSEMNENYHNVTAVGDPAFTSVVDTFFEANTADPLWIRKSTRATRTAELPRNQTSVTISFKGDLLFENAPIARAVCSIEADEAVSHVVGPSSAGHTVTVLVKPALQRGSGSVTCDVDQSSVSQGPSF